MEAQNKLSAKYTKLIVLAIFAVVAFIIYSNSIDSSFHFDDIKNIVENSSLKIKDLSFGSLKEAALSNEYKMRPVSYLSFALNYYFSGFNTTSYHAVNLIIHIINAFLIYLIILRLFDHDSADAVTKERVSVSAFFTAILWLVTPINSMAVIFIVQRMAILMTLFFLLAFFTYLKGRKEDKPIYFLLSFIFFVLSVLSKENGVTVLLVIVLYEFIFIKKGDVKSITKRELCVLAALILILLVPIIIYREAIFNLFARGYKKWEFTAYERGLTQFRVLIFSLSLLLLPIPQRLSITHDIAKSTSLFSPVTTIISIVLVISVIVFSIMRMKRSPYFSFAVLFFFVTLSVELIIPVELFYEHRLYPACIFLIGAAIDYVVSKYYSKSKKAVIAVFLVIALLFGVFTRIRGEVWANGYTLWSDVVSKYPEDMRGNYNLGQSYFENGYYDDALKMYSVAIKKEPDNSEVLFGLGNVYDVYGFYDKSVSYYKQALLNSKPGEDIHYKALNNIGAVYIDDKKYDAVAELYRDYMVAYKDYGALHYILGLAFMNLSRYDDALKEYDLAIKNDYIALKVFTESIRCMLLKGDIKGAESFYKRYEGHYQSSCVNNYVIGTLAEYKGDIKSAKQNYLSYVTCAKTTKEVDVALYVHEANMNLERLK